MNQGRTVAVVGLGYVGLPLAVTFAEHLPTIGFDIDEKRIAELSEGNDRNGEIRAEKLRQPRLELSADKRALTRANAILVTVPTPVDSSKRPDLTMVIEASRLVGWSLAQERRNGNGLKPVVVYESTVYPGTTEEVCVPILEAASGGKAGRDFLVGYSPERINPGDGLHTLGSIQKIISGQNEECTKIVADLYGLVVKAGLYVAPNIRTAEAAKVIENVQRDLNIALMNELSLLFHKLGLDTQEVIRAAGTKWNFLPFQPGLVGGHCIPVDPYYLTHKALEAGYMPEVILAGRRINDSMGHHISQETVKLLASNGRGIQGARVLILGVTFKENVKDTRNSGAVELIRSDFTSLLTKGHGIVIDIKGVLDKSEIQGYGITYWRL
ncbi:MAG: nucleotide sugar dehydrogenase [Chloroflexi bacterium]|nr:nucleotide sugar dehydrogenase [Chloroflexota bacterium]